jgi:hypothetical protein
VFRPPSRERTMPFRSAVPGPAAAGDDRLADLRTLGEQLPRFVRLVHAFKADQATEGRAALGVLTRDVGRGHVMTRSD